MSSQNACLLRTASQTQLMEYFHFQAVLAVDSTEVEEPVETFGNTECRGWYYGNHLRVVQ